MRIAWDSDRLENCLGCSERDFAKARDITLGSYHGDSTMKFKKKKKKGKRNDEKNALNYYHGIPSSRIYLIEELSKIKLTIMQQRIRERVEATSTFQLTLTIACLQ